MCVNRHFGVQPQFAPGMRVRAWGGCGDPEDLCASKGFSLVFSFNLTNLFCCKNQSDCKPCSGTVRWGALLASSLTGASAEGS